MKANSDSNSIVLTARIFLRPCDKLLRDRTNKFTEIELVLRGTVKYSWNCTFQGQNTSNDSRVSRSSITGSKVVSCGRAMVARGSKSQRSFCHSHGPRDRVPHVPKTVYQDEKDQRRVLGND